MVLSRAILQNEGTMTRQSARSLKRRSLQVVAPPLPPQLQKRLHAVHLRQAVGRVVVVHGHHAARMQRIAHRLCSGGIHCVNTPDRHQHGVHRADGRRLLRRQLVPQIAQMGTDRPPAVKIRTVLVPRSAAAPVIMKGLYLPDRKRLSRSGSSSTQSVA